MYSVLSRSKATIPNIDLEGLTEAWNTMGIPGKGAVIGLAAMAAFIPGMLGSRKTGGELRDIYSGNEPVPVRQGRWWELGSTPFEGGRIKAWRPHWSILHKSRSEEASLYGSEKNKWAHNPILHPIKWLRDPYYLEKLHYSDRPYPVASPAFSNVPLVGSMLAATIESALKLGPNVLFPCLPPSQLTTAFQRHGPLYPYIWPLPSSMPWPIPPRLLEPVSFGLENCANWLPAHPETAHMSPVCPGLTGLDDRCVAYRLWEMFVFSLCVLSGGNDPGDLLC